MAIHNFRNVDVTGYLLLVMVEKGGRKLPEAEK
jgi:hypothetical protein